MSPRVGLQDRRDLEDELATQDSSDSSTEGKDGPFPWGPICCLGAVVLLGIAAAMVFLFTHMRGKEMPPEKQTLSADCLGFLSCPSYPQPYGFGEWPKAYLREGPFPEGFVWGLGTGAYQIEGAYREDGRGASIWDTFTGADTVGMPGANCSYCCKKAPCPVNPMMGDKGATGNVACDHYHRVLEDVALMKSMGLKYYRFSIAWSRIYPTGFSNDGRNEAGIAFYNKLIDALLASGITPYVTLYHWDLPQGLLDPPRMQGWWSRDKETGEPNGQITPEFVAFADTCFSAFGDRVKTWFTFNEIWTFTYLGSGVGKAPSIPGFGNHSSDPYIAAHNVLNAHAAAVDLYRQKYKVKQGGQIGITHCSEWREPHSDTPEDIAAAERAVLFRLGWLTDPLYFGDYPAPMRQLLGDRLPQFTEAQKEKLKGSIDILGLNHYGTGWAAYSPGEAGFEDVYASVTEEGFPHGMSAWLYGVGWGMRKILNWIDRRYGHPPIYVTEGGWSMKAESAQEGVADRMRLEYYANYTAEALKAAVEDGVDVRGYFGWSLMDNFEWERGFKERFGTTYTDFGFGFDSNAPMANDKQPTAEGQLRRRKDSSCWLEAVWTANALVDPDGPSFKGCVDSKVFAQTYAGIHPGCEYSISLDVPLANDAFFDFVGTIAVTSPAVGSIRCGNPLDVHWPPVSAKFSGGTILADFSQIKDLEMGAHSVGFWNRRTKAIEWGDGSTWASVTQASA